MNANPKFSSKVLSSMLTMLAVVLMLAAGAQQGWAQGTPCAAQNWSASTPNIWAADGSIKVMLNNSSTTNQPTIPIYEYDGNFNPWGYTQHPQTIAELNDVWSCPSGAPQIAVAGAGRETVSFQVFISAGASSPLSDVSVAITPLSGPGTAITSDNTGTSSVTRYLEGYVAYSGLNPNAPPQLQANGQMPDPLIPFYDPYDSGNPAVATPFNVQSATTQGVWVNISIPASQTAGTYSGTVTVSGNGVGSVSIPVQLTVWNGNLPTFDAGSVNATYADMLKSWLPFYEGSFITGEGLTCGGPGCATGQALMAKYQIMGHAYDIDVQDEGYAGSGLSPTNNGCYPSWGSCTSFTTDGHTSSINWAAYDAYVGPSLTPGGLFSDGTAERVLDSPLSTEGAGAWVGGGWNWTDQNGNAPVPPAGLMQLVTNYATQISQHFAANHTSKGWVVPDLISYTFDETYNNGHGKDLGGNPLIYQIISSYNEAINSSNSALSSTWAASTAPIHNFLTDEPACQEDGDNPQYTNSVCADHINLSYPGGPNSTPGYTNSWVIDWSSNPSIFMPGQPGPALNYGTNPTIIAGTGYKYTYDLTQGVPALSTAPAPIERWFYQGGDPFNTADGISATGVGQRANYWIAYKYGMDETVASAGDPSPATPAPSAVWIWVGNFWGGYNGTSTPSNCNSSGPSPFVSASTGGDGVIFYPGNEVGCYYTANTVGATILTKSAAVNTGCTSNGYSVCNGISGPVASMRMEAMRRGYEDYEYLYLLGKQSGRSAAMAIVNSLGVAGMTAGGLGTTSWQALDWENTDGPWYAMGVEPQSSAYSGYCTDSTPGIGGLANGLPNGSTGAASTGSNFGYGPCPGEWTNNPYRYEAARVQLAQALGFAAAGTTVATPTFSPGGGTYTSAQTVTISDSTSGATIYYTTNGTTPTTSSAVYSTPISVSTTETVKALGVKSGDTNSAIGSATYTISSSTVATPTFSPAAGTYNTTQNVTISDATSGAMIYYTTNGTTPTTSSTVYSSPISVATTETVKALATKSGYTNSAIGSATYTLTAATPTFSPVAGTYGSAQTVTVSDATPGVAMYYTTNGSTPTTSSTVYSAPINVATTETVKVLATKSGYTNSAIGSAAYTISSGGSLPSGWADLDIGSPSIAGSASYSGTTYTVKGSGADIWGTSDQFNYAYTADASANTTIIARVATQTNTNGWAKSGVMIRDTTAAGAIYVGVYITPGEGASMQYRSTTGASAINGPNTTGLVAPYWVRLVRSGSTFTGSISPDGYTWTTMGTATVTLGSSPLQGLAVSSHDNTQLNTSTFDNVSVSSSALPATDSFSGSGPLSASWTNTTANAGLSYPFVPLSQANGVTVPITSTQGKRGLELSTGATFPNDQYSQVKFVYESAGSGSGTGPCVRMGLNGNGVCWLVDSNVVYTISSGAWYGPSIITGCPVPSAGDTVKLSVAGTTYTCTDVTKGTHASGTNSDFSSGVPAILVDQYQSTSYALDNFQAD